jgi:predicted membrane-bound mannosyltransferase
MTPINTVTLVLIAAKVGVSIGAVLASIKKRNSGETSQAIISFLFPVAFCIAGSLILDGIFGLKFLGD